MYYNSEYHSILAGLNPHNPVMARNEQTDFLKTITVRRDNAICSLYCDKLYHIIYTEDCYQLSFQIYTEDCYKPHNLY